MREDLGQCGMSFFSYSRKRLRTGGPDRKTKQLEMQRNEETYEGNERPLVSLSCPRGPSRPARRRRTQRGTPRRRIATRKK